MVKPFDWQVSKLLHGTPTLTVALTFCLPLAVFLSVCTVLHSSDLT